MRFLDFVADAFGLISAAKSFWKWHANQALIYGWRFVLFQVSVNAAYGVATSFWYFFIPFYLDEEGASDGAAHHGYHKPAFAAVLTTSSTASRSCFRSWAFSASVPFRWMSSREKKS